MKIPLQNLSLPASEHLNPLNVALVGRTNVGKSTLFNTLTRERYALVSNTRGMTRDCLQRLVHYHAKSYLFIDTGGWDVEADTTSPLIARNVHERTKASLGKVDLVILVVDAGEGFVPFDQNIISFCRRQGKLIWLVVNKIDLKSSATLFYDFSPLGLDKTFFLSARTKKGIVAFLDALDKLQITKAPSPSSKVHLTDALRLVLLGKPNSGKSTLVNCLLDSDVMITSKVAGTTRNSVENPFIFQGMPFMLLDTAGVRRRSRSKEEAEILSILQTFRMLKKSPLAILVCDMTTGITDQDASLATEVFHAGCALVVAINKADRASVSTRNDFNRSLDTSFRFLRYVEIVFISALYNKGMDRLMYAVKRAKNSFSKHISTGECNRLLQNAILANPPPGKGGVATRLKYMCQINTSPPRFAIFGNRTDRLSGTYKHYLCMYMRKRIGMGTPVLLDFCPSSRTKVQPGGRSTTTLATS